MLFYEEQALNMTPERRIELETMLFKERQLPSFAEKVKSVSYEDGCKVCFEDGSWVVCRFSGTEPLLRIAAEGKTSYQARNLAQQWRSLLRL